MGDLNDLNDLWAGLTWQQAGAMLGVGWTALAVAVSAAVVLWKAVRWGAAGWWHAGAWLTTPGPLSDEARRMITGVLGAEKFEAKVGAKAHTFLKYGDTTVGRHAIDVGGKEVGHLFSRRDRRAVRAAYRSRLAFLDAVERDALRAAAAEGKALAGPKIVPPQGGTGARQPRCSCGQPSCGVCGR